MHLVMADQGNSGELREYRKGNWTVHETSVLIAAKKMDEERRMKRSGDGEGRGKPAELRWKWVEDYCWRHGCLRSQNQCNDKWDNLMRDYKKVREYERRLAERGSGEEGSYWKLEKQERKERNLPSNMLPEIYDAVVEVVEKRVVPRVSGGSVPNIGLIMEKPTATVQPSVPPLLQYHISSNPTPPLPLPPPPPPPQPLPHSQPLLSLDSDTSERSNSSAKRRRRGERTSSSGNTSYEVGSAISKSASIIAEALHACEEKEEKRHKDLLSLQERRLKVEESKTEINREGINGLVDSINKLASSILALVSDKNSSAPKCDHSE